MDENPEEPQCVCANNYVEGKGTESVLFSILFSPEDRRDKRNERSAQLQKRHGLLGEMRAWCEQTMINTAPSPQTPVCLDVILSANNRPALYRSHSLDAEQGRVGAGGGAAAAFSQCVQLWYANTETFFFFFFFLI